MTRKWIADKSDKEGDTDNKRASLRMSARKTGLRLIIAIQIKDDGYGEQLIVEEYTCELNQ